MSERAEWMRELVAIANSAVDLPKDADGCDAILSYTEWLEYLDAIIDNALATREIMDAQLYAENGEPRPASTTCDWCDRPVLPRDLRRIGPGVDMACGDCYTEMS